MTTDDKIRERKKLYAQTDKGKIANRKRNKKHYAKHREREKQRIKSLATLPTRQYTYLKRRAKVANVPFEIELADFIEIRSTNKCHYCKIDLSLTAPNIDRLDSSKGYSKQNCVPCCLRCNTVKRDLLLPEELLMFHAILQGEMGIPQVTKLYSLHNVTKCSSVRKRWGRLVRASKDKNINLEISFEQYHKLLSQPCAYCGTENIGTGYGLDKKNPEKNIGYTIENSVSCCTPCNQIKSNFLTYNEMKILMVVVSYHRLK
jgi:hypothetical protein